MKKILNPVIMFCILFLGGLLTRHSVEHQQLYIAVIANTLLYVAGYCMGYKDNDIRPKSKDIKCNYTFCMHDNDPSVTVDMDEDKNIVGFSTVIKDIQYVDIYNSLFINKQIITIIYNENGEEHKYDAVITQTNFIDNELEIYYTVLNKYVED